MHRSGSSLHSNHQSSSSSSSTKIARKIIHLSQFFSLADVRRSTSEATTLSPLSATRDTHQPNGVPRQFDLNSSGDICQPTDSQSSTPQESPRDTASNNKLHRSKSDSDLLKTRKMR